MQPKYPRLYLCALILVVLSLLACRVLPQQRLRQPTDTPPPPVKWQAPGQDENTAGGGQVPSQEEGQQPGQGSDQQTGQEGDQQTGQEGDQGGGSQPDQVVPEGMDLAPCPEPGTSLLLKFSAAMSISYEDAKIDHTLDDGLLNLMVVGDDPSSTAIESVEGTAIPYTMEGAMGPCTLSGGGTMSPSAYGYCQDGIVYLIITEDWGPYQGTMTCPDAVVPLNFPAPGVMTHTGADGRGEIFYLDRNYSTEGAGYTSIRPFQEGQGEHIWTLFWDDTAPVKP
jgi:hypothetical protein